MKRYLVATTVLVCGVAHAQIMQMADVEKMPAMHMRLLENAAVQKELKLDSKQKAEIKKIIDEFSKAVGGSQAADNDIAASMAMLNQFNEKMAEADNRLIAVLDETQAVRYREVRYQVLGMRSLAEPEVQATLGLTDDQKSKVSAYEKSCRDGLLESMRGGASGMSKWKKEREKREADFAKMLTPDQQAKLDALFGAKFKDVKRIRG